MPGDHGDPLTGRFLSDGWKRLATSFPSFPGRPATSSAVGWRHIVAVRFARSPGFLDDLCSSTPPRWSAREAETASLRSLLRRLRYCAPLPLLRGCACTPSSADGTPELQPAQTTACPAPSAADVSGAIISLSALHLARRAQRDDTDGVFVPSGREQSVPRSARRGDSAGAGRPATERRCATGLGHGLSEHCPDRR